MVSSHYSLFNQTAQMLNFVSTCLQDVLFRSKNQPNNTLYFHVSPLTVGLLWELGLGVIFQACCENKLLGNFFIN